MGMSGGTVGEGAVPRINVTPLIDVLLVLLIITTVAGNLAGSVLQKTAGPTAYSQIGYVIALTGVAASSFVFGEHLGMLFWPGLFLVFSGVLLTNSATLPKRLEAALSLHRRATAQS